MKPSLLEACFDVIDNKPESLAKVKPAGKRLNVEYI